MMAFTAGAEEDQKQNPHIFGEQADCSYCHTTIPKLKFDSITTCTRCHPGNLTDHPTARHPLARAPRINVPRNLPLSRDGQLICFTCHDPHKRTGNPNMLRLPFDKLCAACHVGY